MQRRWFPSRLVLLLVLMVLAVTMGMVAALPNESHAQSPITNAEKVTAPQAVSASPGTMSYSTLVDAQSGGPETLDPHWMYDTASQRVAAQVYETLFMHEREDPAAWVPLLATSWDVSPNATEYTFTIRRGVTFHAGGSLQPHDVAYSTWRAILQDRPSGPAWMLLEPLFGVYDVEDIPGTDAAKCQAVKDAATYDDAAGTVTFHLPASYGPFLDVLATQVGMVVDQEWMAAIGDWGGNCANWRDYHSPARLDSHLYDQMNGTGPFRFVRWTADEIRLERFDNYWRQEPIWAEGPSGPATLAAVVLEYVADWNTRRTMLLDGVADIAYVPAPNRTELSPFLWGAYDGYQDRDPTLVHPVTGTLRLFKNLPLGSQTTLLFNCDINADTTRYTGSGALDGNGIPTDFFADLHVRQAFNYAMDWSTIISGYYGGEAVRSRGPIPKGMLGHTDTQPVYGFSPVLSTQEFQQAWSGDVWKQGFSMTLAYEMGNTYRQALLETLARGIESLNSKFHVNVVAESWPTPWTGLANRRMPVFVSGWSEDYHHPHNWVQPYLHSQGAFMSFQSLPTDLLVQLDAKIAACFGLTDLSAARTCYEELQNMSYVDAAAIWGVQPLGRDHVRAEVRGYFANPAFPYPYYYALSKGAPPTVATVSSAVNNTVPFTYTSGTTATLLVPAGIVDEDSTVVFTPDVVVEESHPGGFRLAGLTFDLQICQNGDCLADYVFAHPVTVTLEYQDADIAGVLEDQLYLYTWDGSAWVDAVLDCGWLLTAYERYPAENKLVVPLCHFSQFGLVGGTRNLYLPVVLNRN